MKKRHLRGPLLEALADTPVVYLVGARQSGKTTLARAAVGGRFPARYLSMDDPATLAAARTDPAVFLQDLEGPAILDEIQRAPELAGALRGAVDRRREPGRYLLTGSAEILATPRLAESMVGRMEVLTLWPFSQGEIEGSEESFPAALFGEELPPGVGIAEERSALVARALRGGFPEPLERSPTRQNAWFDSYVATLLQRDVRELARIEGLADLPRLLRLLASRATGLTNFAEISRASGIAQTTLKRYLALLEQSFLLRRLPAWTRNRSKRLVRSAKLFFTDTGLLAHLAGWSAGRLDRHPEEVGPLLENFAISELQKQLSWSGSGISAYHFRTSTGREVDLVLEDAAGRVVGVEVKSRGSLHDSDFHGLRALAEAAGEDFHRGVVLYTGTERLAFGARLHCLPMSALWTLGVE